MIQFYRGEDCCPERSGDLPQVTQQGWGLGFESVFTAIATAKSLQSCLTLCNPIPGILQARTLEWVAISFSNVSK